MRSSKNQSNLAAGLGQHKAPPESISNYPLQIIHYVDLTSDREFTEAGPKSTPAYKLTARENSYKPKNTGRSMRHLGLPMYKFSIICPVCFRRCDPIESPAKVYSLMKKADSLCSIPVIMME